MRPPMGVYKPQKREETFLCAVKHWYAPWAPDGGAPRSFATRYNFDEGLHRGAPGLGHAGAMFTPLEFALQHAWLSVIKWLIEQGADTNAKTVETISGRRSTLLRQTPNSYVAALLLYGGAQVDARDHAERTPLHWAAMMGVTAVGLPLARLYLSRGASLDARVRGEDPEATANRRGNTVVAALLAEVRAAGGWRPYADVPRAQLLKFRRALPSLRERGRALAPSSDRLHERLFVHVPEDVFTHVVAYWRSDRDPEYLPTIRI